MVAVHARSTAAVLLSFCVVSGSVVAAPWAAQATERVEHYDQLRALLFAGAAVTAVFSPDQCDAGARDSDTAAPTIRGGFVVHDFIEVVGDNLGFSNQHLTMRADGTAVLEIMQYRLRPDDSAAVRISFLSPLTFLSLSTSQTFSCRLGKGLSFVAQGSDAPVQARRGPTPHAPFNLMQSQTRSLDADRRSP
ncbi:MAG: putative exported protein [Rhodospirillales bacterium]|jgi:hypothetical protein|nr:putative exported protein [Rhodospirillales bacterium]